MKSKSRTKRAVTSAAGSLDRELARLAPKVEALAGGRISFALLSEAKIREINLNFRKKDKSTDVLSFPAPKVFADAGLLGEVLICRKILRDQAKERGISPEHELRVLMVHGATHLAGYNHELSRRELLRQAKVELEWLGRLKRARDPELFGLIEREHAQK